ncbi:hypothetical protein VP01_2606g1 [Puccinia sorghi]|uniref:Uncharacterized protein n=1 Tax=Puccinia sorghi TaxID=27349 RepID=A0A0L6V4M1_9BASI|nr:hypothetical protein VP01_2606g1 [Puccinia sorghi]
MTFHHFYCYCNLSPRLIQPSFDAQSLQRLCSECAKTSTYANRWSLDDSLDGECCMSTAGSCTGFFLQCYVLIFIFIKSCLDNLDILKEQGKIKDWLLNSSAEYAENSGKKKTNGLILGHLSENSTHITLLLLFTCLLLVLHYSVPPIDHQILRIIGFLCFLCSCIWISLVIVVLYTFFFCLMFLQEQMTEECKSWTMDGFRFDLNFGCSCQSGLCSGLAKYHSAKKMEDLVLHFLDNNKNKIIGLQINMYLIKLLQGQKNGIYPLKAELHSTKNNFKIHFLPKIQSASQIISQNPSRHSNPQQLFHLKTQHFRNIGLLPISKIEVRAPCSNTWKDSVPCNKDQYLRFPNK